MDSLQELLHCARQENLALGRFNTSNLEQTRVIYRICRDLKSPAIIGTSEAERSHMGLAKAPADYLPKSVPF